MLKRVAAPLRVQAVNALRREIVAGSYLPGTRLTEKHLEERLGVSRTVVREALRQLESERLIVIQPNVGPVVRELSIDDITHLYEVRGTLESAAGGLAARHRSAEQLAELRRVLGVIVERAEKVSTPELVELKNDFYDTLIASAGNPIIGEMLHNVQARISQLRGITLTSPGRTPHMIAELRRILNAIEEGDAEAAAALCQAHVTAAAEIALQHATHAYSQKEATA